MRVSELERDSTKAEWDFRDRKLARWAKKREGKTFKAKIVDISDDTVKATIINIDIVGVVVTLKNSDFMLFDEVDIIINRVDIARALILAQKVS